MAEEFPLYYVGLSVKLAERADLLDKCGYTITARNALRELHDPNNPSYATPDDPFPTPLARRFRTLVREGGDETELAALEGLFGLWREIMVEGRDDPIYPLADAVDRLRKLGEVFMRLGGGENLVPLSAVPMNPQWTRELRLRWVVDSARWFRTWIPICRAHPAEHDIGKSIHGVSDLWNAVVKEMPREVTAPLHTLRDGLTANMTANAERALLADLITVEDEARRLAGIEGTPGEDDVMALPARAQKNVDDVAREVEAIVKGDGGKWPGYGALESMGYARGTLQKAAKNSRYLAARLAESKPTPGKNPKAVTLSKKIEAGHGAPDSELGKLIAEQAKDRKTDTGKARVRKRV